MSLLENLQQWHDAGYTVLPCIAFWTAGKDGKPKRHKQPLVSWEQYQNRRPTQEEINTWGTSKFKDYAGVCIVTGNGLVGVDFDQKDGRPNTDPWGVELIEHGTTSTITGSGGVHYYFRADQEIKNATNIFGGTKEDGDTVVDIRGEGGIIVVGYTPLWDKDPRSDEGAKIVGEYKTHNLVPKDELGALPQSFLVRSTELPARWKMLSDGMVREGSRHDMAKSIIAKFVHAIKTPDDLPVMKEAFRRIMRDKFDGQLDEGEVQSLFDWAMEKERKKRGEGWYLFSSVIKDAVKKTKTEQEFKEDMNDWGINIVHVERNDERMTFHTDDGKVVIVLTTDLFSQVKFRAAYLRGTNIVLPEIRKKSYLAFLTSLKITEIENMGSSFDESVIEAIANRTDDIAPCESEGEAVEIVRVRGWAKYDGHAFFRLPVLIFELKKSLGNFQKTAVIDALRTNGFTYVKKAHVRYWVGRIGSAESLSNE